MALKKPATSRRSVVVEGPHFTDLFSSSYDTGKKMSATHSLSSAALSSSSSALFAHSSFNAKYFFFRFRFVFVNHGTAVRVLFRYVEFRRKLTSFCCRNPTVSLPRKSAGVCKCVATPQESKTGIAQMTVCFLI